MSAYAAAAADADALATEHHEAKAAFMAASQAEFLAKTALEAASARYALARAALIAARAERSVFAIRAEGDAEGAR